MGRSTTSHFKEREDAMADVLRLLKPGESVVACVGPPVCDFKGDGAPPDSCQHCQRFTAPESPQ